LVKRDYLLTTQYLVCFWPYNIIVRFRKALHDREDLDELKVNFLNTEIL
jgi:hypothetical protein